MKSPPAYGGVLHKSWYFVFYVPVRSPGKVCRSTCQVGAGFHALMREINLPFRTKVVVSREKISLTWISRGRRHGVN